MANENEDIQKANEGGPVADIPDLKKKEKERKKAGAAWGGAKPGSSPFSGATGGAGSGARAAASAASSAASAGSPAAGSMAAFFATGAGKALLALGGIVVLGGAAAVGFSLMNGGATGGLGAANLGGLTNSISARRGTNDSTGWLNSKGEIRFDPLKQQKPEPKKEEAPKTDAAPAPEEQTADAAGAQPDWRQNKMENNLSGSKLSSSLGGGFGNKNIFAGGGGTTKFNDGIGKINIPTASRGKLGAMSKSAVKGRATTRAAGPRLRSNRAFGQLRTSNAMSGLAQGSNSAEQASAYATNAFDGQGNANTLDAQGPAGNQAQVVSPMGGGAPNTNLPNVDVPTGVGMDHDTTAMLASIGQMANSGADMIDKGQNMMWLGAAIMVIGYVVIKAAPAAGPWAGLVALLGKLIVLIGAMIVGMGYMMMEMGKMMAEMAKSMGSALAARTGDANQAAIINYCTDQAVQGTPTQNCNPPADISGQQQMLDVQSDGVQQHRDMVDRDSQVTGP